MQPLGITKRQHDELYVPFLLSPHDFEIDVDVLNMNEKVIGSINGQFKDGQVNIQRDGTIKRTATFTLYDPDHSVNFDSDSPFAGGLFANKMLRYRYGVDVPGLGMVWATPFVGPVSKLDREGDNLTVECQEKTLLAVEGCLPMTVKKGRNAISAIRAIMEERTGERRFRFPSTTRRLTKNYSVGWKSESSPWSVCQKIAASIDMQLLYACDGALVLRRRPTAPAVNLTALTGPVRAGFDIMGVRNYVRVTGEKKVKVGTQSPKKTKHEKFTEGALPPRTHPLSPAALGRNGVSRYLPVLIDDSSIKKEKDAQKRADKELAKALPMSVSASFPGLPLFHLDWSDIVRATTEFGAMNLPLHEGSIPLGTGGDAEYGTQRVVSKPRRIR